MYSVNTLIILGGIILSIIQAIILGIFQGVTEFLPISSSGHLVLLQKLFNINEGTLFFTVMLHLGTFVSIVIVYFKDIMNIIIECIKLIVDVIKNKRIVLDNDYKILGVLVIVGSIPTVLMGVLLGDLFTSFYNSLTVVGCAFIITGFILFIAEKKSKGNKNVRNFRIVDALIIGIFQGFAITPGISRSGSTIVGALFMGLNKKLATKFSFFLALPAILGASLLELFEVFGGQSNISISFPIVLGTIISAIVGIISINILIKMLEKRKLHYFSYYLWILGSITLVVNLF